jgi:hypothetical protein
MSIEPTAPIAAGRSLEGPTAPRRAPAPATTPAADRVELSGDIPDAPPPEVLDQVRVAARVAQELHDGGRELRFTADAEARRVVVEVRDLDGNVLRTIPPSQALGIASGEEGS